MKNVQLYINLPSIRTIHFIKSLRVEIRGVLERLFCVRVLMLFIPVIFFTFLAVAQTRKSKSAANISEKNVGGYMIVQTEKVDQSYNAGFSIYSAAWPLLKAYPGSSFQSGLFGT